MKPSAVNHGQTINGYWMEQSRGKFGITDVVTLKDWQLNLPKVCSDKIFILYEIPEK